MRYLIAVLCALAVVVTQVLYGGAMRPVFALPGLFLVGVAGVLGLAAVVWKNVPPPSLWCVGSVLAFAGWLIGREMHSPDAWLAAGYLRLTLGCLVMYLIFACIITNPFHRLAFAAVLFLSAFFQSALAGVQFARTDTGPVFPWLSEQLRVWYEPRWNLRGHGTYLSANHLAWFLNGVGFLALAAAFWGRWGLKTKILCLYIAITSFAGVVVTLSRGGMLAFGAGMTVFLALSAAVVAVGARNRRLVALLGVSAGVFLAVSVAFLLFRGSFIVQQRYEELISDRYRPAIFGAVLRQAQLDPVWGTGSGSFVYYGRLYRDMIGFNDDVYAHNDWMQIAGDFGVPALVLLVAVVWIHGSRALGGAFFILRKRVDSYERPQSHALALGIGALSCLGVFVVHSFLDFNMQIPANALFAASVLGMLANLGSTPTGKRFPGLARRTFCLLNAGLAVWLGWLVVQTAPSEVHLLKAENAKMVGLLEEARIQALAGLKFGPNSRLHQVLGETYLLAAKYAPGSAERRKWTALGVAQFEIAVQLNPLDTETRLRLSEGRRILGETRASQAELFEAIVRSPMQGRGYEVYGEMLEAGGRWEEALQAYRFSMHIPGNVHSRKSAAEMARKLQILGN